MRWKTNERLWHRHFCWVPTRVDGTKVWLEHVWRRQDPLIREPLAWPFKTFGWEYRLDVSGWDADRIYGPHHRFTAPRQREAA